ncbi:MAG TPA: hypothetical protein VFA60_03340 [Terriglobales bacterium]|nr:hypothetical protein [Terriglobales bacterium]
MARRKKQKPFRAADAVKAAAREHIGSPRPTRVARSRRRPKEEKHKPTLGKLLEQE